MSFVGEQKFDICDELDATVACGSGYISLFGPPGSGKSTLLLRYLTARERHVCNIGGLFHLEYVTARAMDSDPLQRLAWRLQAHTKRRRADCTILQFEGVVRQWLDAAPETSELHFVVDDADVLEDNTTGINHWLSGSLITPTEEQDQKTVFLWVVSQIPLHLSNCFRFHFLARPDVGVVRKWLDDLFLANRAIVLNDPATDVPHLTLEQTHTAVADAVAHYTTHFPMCVSAVAQDIRQLLLRVHDVLPLLAHRCDGGRPNAMDYSAAWGRQRAAKGVTTTTTTAGGGGGGDLLVAALQRIGCSAMLWAVSAFYCGAVPRSRQAHVIDGQALSPRAGLRGRNSTSHKAAVLSSSAHVVRVARLMVVYDALLRICVHHVDPLEFSPAETAVQHHQTLVSWGLLVPSARSSKDYRCHIPVTSAVGLAQLLSLSLYDLIPQ